MRPGTTVLALLGLALSSQAQIQVIPYGNAGCRESTPLNPIQNATLNGTTYSGAPNYTDPGWFSFGKGYPDYVSFRAVEFGDIASPQVDQSSFNVWWKVPNVPASCRIVLLRAYDTPTFGHVSPPANLNPSYSQPPGNVALIATAHTCGYSNLITDVNLIGTVCCNADCDSLVAANPGLIPRGLMSQEVDEGEISEGRRERRKTFEERRGTEAMIDKRSTKEVLAEFFKEEDKKAKIARGEPVDEEDEEQLMDRTVEQAQTGPKLVERKVEEAEELTWEAKRALEEPAEAGQTNSHIHARHEMIFDRQDSGGDVPSNYTPSCVPLNDTIQGPFTESGYQLSISSSQYCTAAPCWLQINRGLVVESSLTNTQIQRIALQGGSAWGVTAGKLSTRVFQDVTKLGSTETSQGVIKGTTMNIIYNVGQPQGTQAFASFTGYNSCYAFHVSCDNGPPSPQPFVLCNPQLDTTKNQPLGSYWLVYQSM